MHRLRKIYGPVKENELCRIRRNGELEATIKGENIVRFIKCQRIRWLGHIERMQDTAFPKKMLFGKLYATRRRGRPKMGWLDDVSMDLRKMGLTLRRLMSYIYMEHPFLMFLDHTQRRSTVGRTPLDE